MNIAYFGSPKLSAQLLSSLIKNKNIQIKLIVTQPDRPAGKHLALTPTDVKNQAKISSIQVFDQRIDSIQEQELINQCKNLNIELCIVFAFGAMISLKLLDSVKFGFWNIHPSRLPKYRGAAPTTYPIALGERTTGVTLIQMNEEMDQGAIIDQVDMPIDLNMNRTDIEAKTIPIATTMIEGAVNALEENGSVPTKPQTHANASYTRRITKQDGFIPLDLLVSGLKIDKKIQNGQLPRLINSYYEENNVPIFHPISIDHVIWNMYRALTIWPGIWTFVPTPQGEKRLLIKNMSFADNRLTLKLVQLEGKKEVLFSEFLKTYNIFE